MAAQLGASKSAARDTRRILRRQVRKALKVLGDHGMDDEGIHDARKRIKRARAVLRLLRPALSKSDYRRGNRLLRDAAQPLSAARDAKILVEACDGVLRRSAHAREIGGTGRLRKALVRGRQERRRALMRDGELQRACRLLRRARRAAAGWSLRENNATDLTAGAQRIYAQGREALQQVRAQSSVDRLHEWRKQAKYLYLLLEVLEPLYGPAVSHLAEELEKLSDDLGEDHDLALLRESVATHLGELRSASGASELATLIEHTRTALQRRALLRGSRLYRQSPAGFRSRLAHPKQPRG